MIFKNAKRMADIFFSLDSNIFDAFYKVSKLVHVSYDIINKNC